MPQETKNTANPTGIGFSTAQMDTLLSKFTTGQIIRRSDVQLMLDYYADFRTHTHSLTDISRLKTFGNTGSSSSASDATGNPTNLNGTPGDPAVNSLVTASKHNEIRNALNSIRAHIHQWTDNNG